MRNMNIAWFFLLCGGLACVLCADRTMAQRRRTGGTSVRPAGGVDTTRESRVLRVRKFTGLGRQSLIKTPQYRTNIGRSAKPERNWVKISVTYETAPEWMDELTFQYYALSLKTERGRPSYSLFKKAVKYMDIEIGRDHISAVFLRPTALKRYGMLVAIAVEISYDGKVVAERGFVDSADKNLKPREDSWWKDPAVTESKAVTVRDGYLLDRSESPFALINIDNYEVIR